MHSIIKKPLLISTMSLAMITYKDAFAIINGDDASVSELPFFSQIHFKDSEDIYFGGKEHHISLGKQRVKWDNQCGGILIYKNYILTAKHCVMDKDGAFDEIRVSYLGEPGMLFEVDSIYTPPTNYLEQINYFPNSDSTTQINYKNGDVAILHVPSINPDTPHSLAAQNNNINNKFISNMHIGENGTIYGMGLTTRNESLPRTSTLKRLDMTVVSSDECSENNGYTLKGNPYIGYQANIDTEVCARSLVHDDKYRAAYKYDSGGPLLLKEGKNYVLAGVISHSLWKDFYHPENDNTPSLTLASADSFKHWINNVIGVASTKTITLLDMYEIHRDGGLLARNNEVYLYSTSNGNKKYEKIEYINGSLSRVWHDDLELSKNQTLALTPKNKWIIDVNANFLSIYDLIGRRWGSAYFHDFIELNKFIDSPAIANDGVHLFTKFGTIYSAKVLVNGNLYDLRKTELPSVEGLKKIYVYSDVNGYKYYSLSEDGKLLISDMLNKWAPVSFSGVTSSHVEDIAFSSRGMFFVKIESQWYYNDGFKHLPNSKTQTPLVRLERLVVKDHNNNELLIKSVALSADHKKLYAVGEIDNKTYVVVGDFISS